MQVMIPHSIALLVQQSLVLLNEYKSSKRVAIFTSMEGEVDTFGMIQDILDSGKSCFIPRCKGNVMQMVRIASMQDLKSLSRNAWGILEPNWEEDREEGMALADPYNAL